MHDYDLIIRNGLVVFEQDIIQMDVAIKDGKIKALEKQLDATAIRQIEAIDHYIFPGAIDVHAHFSEPGRADWEGFTTGSQMMAAGGITTFFDMPLNGIPSTVTKQALIEKAKLGQQKSYVDFGLWGGLVPGNVEHLQEMAEEGVIGFKAFISPTGNKEFENVDDFTLLSGMKEIAKLGKVLALHAESAEITTWLMAEKMAQQDKTADAYLATRPIVAEVEAVERALHYAKITGCPLHFVHISSAEAIEVIEAAKVSGQDVTLETCPHYLLFTHRDLCERGAVAKCAPPLREARDQQRLADCVVASKVDFITSDHSPCPDSMKDAATIFDAWGGISGGQFTLLSCIEFALKHKLSFSEVAKWTAIHPAQRFNLAKKGSITVGMDADLAIIQLQPFTATEENFYAKHKRSIYLNRTFPCSVTQTISNGSVIFENQLMAAAPPAGKWLAIK